METNKVTLVVTNSCNLNCTYCYENCKTNKRMSFYTAKENISDLIERSDKGSFNVVFFWWRTVFGI